MARSRIYAQPLTGAEKQWRHREKRKEEDLRRRSMLAVIGEEITEAAKEKDSYGRVTLQDFTLLGWAKAINKVT